MAARRLRVHRRREEVARAFEMFVQGGNVPLAIEVAQAVQAGEPISPEMWHALAAQAVNGGGRAPRPNSN